MEWLEITVITTHAYADVIAVFLNDKGSDGVSISDKYDIIETLESKQNWDYADDSLINYADERVFVKGFFDCDIDIEEFTSDIESLRAAATAEGVACGSLEIVKNTLDSTDWENEWRKYYQPIFIDKVAIIPEWIDYKGDLKTVKLDPGMAFGTGNHETTALCVRLMQEYDLNNLSVADIGCGSGILGIAALKLGAKHCYFADIDDQAVTATNFNLKLNNIGDKATVIKGSLKNEGGNKFGFIVANITADILLALRQIFYDNLENGGGLVLSGIIHSRAEEIKKEYRKLFTPITNVLDGEWQAMSFIKVAKG